MCGFVVPVISTLPGAFAESHLPAVMSGISTRLQFGLGQEVLAMAGG
jgi:hypothetical protein